ncbi:MAG TPA: glycosyltransferase family 4 protein [Longimicrobiales bacterium]|nr:glycosyltransferase family 4 protein [Longimicrobiales bacterium]
MRILFLTDNFPPEVNAPAARTHVHCKAWVEAGHEVTVITCAPNFPQGRVYEGYRNRLRQTEIVDGIRVVRVWSYMAPNAGFGRRIADYLSFAFSATVAGLGEEFDVLVATSPQFFTAVAASVLSHLKRRPWVFEIRDLWPESIIAAGAMERGTVVEALERLELGLYRSADQIVAVTRSFRENLVGRGVDPRKVRVIRNGVDTEAFDPPVPRNGNGPFRVGYLGTHGMAHGLDLVLRTAPRFEPGEVEFELIGDGARKAELVEEARRRALPNVRFRDPVPRERIAEVLGGFDACLVPLRDTPTFRSVIPSKIFEAAAARRPILLGVRGEAEDLVREYEAGLVFTPESEEELAGAIESLRTRPDLYTRLQEGGARLAADFERGRLAAEMLSGLEGLVPGSAPRGSARGRGDGGEVEPEGAPSSSPPAPSPGSSRSTARS